MPTTAPEPALQPGVAVPRRRAALHVVGLRVLQFGVDLALMTVLCMLPLAVTLVLPRNPDGTLGALLVSIPVILLALLVSAAISAWYWVWRPARHGGRTFAMGWFRLRVVRADGSDVGAALLALRWVMLLVDGLFFGLVGLVAMLATRRAQRLGDVVADTLVVSTMPAAGAEPPRAT